MFKNFLLKSLIKSQMKNVPAEQQEFILTIIEKNPEFFMKISKEAQEKIKGGMSQEDAMMRVMKEHEEELKQIMGK